MNATNANVISRVTVSNRRVRPIALGIVLGIGILAAPGTSHAGLDPVNLALAKTTTQSSTWGDGVSWKAVDGNINGTYAAGSVTHTSADPHSWWQVDLGEVRQIGRIEISNRVDCCSERLSPFMVIVSDFSIIDSDMTDADAALYPGIMRTQVLENRQTHSIPINRSGRYVRIALVNQNFLSLAEVKVFEAPNAAMGRFAMQSSTVSGGVAGRAVDGSVNGVFTSGSVSTTNVEASPWWQVDLGMLHNLREIHVWSSNTDCCAQANPKKGYFVWISPNFISGNPETSHQPGATGYFVSAQGAPAIVPVAGAARYVRIQLSGTDALSLAEVQVWTVARGSLGGHASQSSFALSGRTANGPIDYDLFNGAAAPTQTQNEPYWEVDLGGTRYLETIRLWSGGDASLSTYNLFVSSTPFSSTTVADTRAQAGVSSWIGRGTVTGSSANAIRRKGRFVRVMLDGWKALSGLAEVEVVTTEGVALGNVNGGVGPNPVTRQFPGFGYHSRPGTAIYAYAFRPNAGSGGGSYVYVGAATSSTTPTISSFAGVPVYGFTFTPFTTPADTYLQGGVGGIYYEAADDNGVNTAPLRTFDNDGTESPFWPDLRQVSDTPTPDDTSNHPVYLDSPMGDWKDPDYYRWSVNSNSAYQEIPATLSVFNQRYMSGGSSPPVSARFYNENELGIGRNLKCAHKSWLGELGAVQGTVNGTVCMIANHGPVGSSGYPTFGDKAGSLAALQNAPPRDTVVIVLRDGSTKPWFGTYDSAGNRTFYAPHDNTTARMWVPNNCMTCHGGSGATTPTSNYHYFVKYASLLPIDPFAVAYGSAPYAYADQVENIRQINQLVLASNPPAPGVKDLINGLYPSGVSVAGSQPDPNYVPSGWKGTAAQTKVYNNAIKPYCRMCHISQIPADGGVDLLKASDAEAMRALIVMDVCKTRRMPHAQQTMKRFWASGARSYLLGFLGRHDLDGELCAP